MVSSIAHGIINKWSRIVDPNTITNETYVAKPEVQVGRVFVLRLGHRIDRDNRATTHVFLTARAFGASGVIYSGQKDEPLEKRMRDTVDRWGGSFEVSYEKNWKSTVRDWKKRGGICHLTMYGININDCLEEIPENKDLLIVVGSEKVPGDIYRLADFNIAVGNQPHSEIAALAVFLDRFYRGKGLKQRFANAKMRIEPQRSGKKVIIQP